MGHVSWQLAQKMLVQENLPKVRAFYKSGTACVQMGTTTALQSKRAPFLTFRSIRLPSFFQYPPPPEDSARSVCLCSHTYMRNLGVTMTVTVTVRHQLIQHG